MAIIWLSSYRGAACSIYQHGKRYYIRKLRRIFLPSRAGSNSVPAPGRQWAWSGPNWLIFPSFWVTASHIVQISCSSLTLYFYFYFYFYLLCLRFYLCLNVKRPELRWWGALAYLWIWYDLIWSDLKTPSAQHTPWRSTRNHVYRHYSGIT